MTPEAPKWETCDQKGCEKPPTQQLLTNYGSLGWVCDEHYGAFARILGDDQTEPPPPGTFPPQCHTLAPGPTHAQPGAYGRDGWADVEDEGRLR